MTTPATLFIAISIFCSICSISSSDVTVATSGDDASNSNSHTLVTYTYGPLKEKYFPEFHSPLRNFSFQFLNGIAEQRINVSIAQQYKANASGVGSAVWEGSAVLSSFISRRAYTLFLTTSASPVTPSPQHVIIEIGAGQGLVSIVTTIALQKLQQQGSQSNQSGARVHVTDGDESCLVQTQRNLDSNIDNNVSNVVASTNVVRWGNLTDLASFGTASWVFAADVVFENENENENENDDNDNEKGNKKVEKENQKMLHAANHAFAALTKSFDYLIPQDSKGALLLAYKRRRKRESRFFDMMNDYGFHTSRVKKRFVHYKYRNMFELFCFAKDDTTCQERLGRLVKLVVPSV